MNLVIFDLDNTLLKGDSDYNWALFLIKKGFLDKESYEQKNEQFIKIIKMEVLMYLNIVNFNLRF